MDEKENIKDDIKEEKITQEKENKVKGKLNKKHSKFRKRILFLIIIIVVCILVTALLIYLKIKKISEQSNVSSSVENEVFVTDKTNKKQAEDLKYVCKGFEDTYNQNDLKIVEIKDGDDSQDYKKEKYTRISYIQISGLIDSNIEDSINKEIKELVYDMIGKNKSDRNDISVIVTANFSNVLSLEIRKTSSKWVNNQLEDSDIQTRCLNYNLVNGEKLKIEDLFVSSAPIASIISDVAYNTLAWDTNLSFELSGEERDKNTNMDKRDTSEYEEELLAIVNKYNRKKEEIEFSFSPTRLYIYDLVKPGKEGHIKLMDYINDLTIYNKYADANIYTANDIGLKNVFVFTTPISTSPKGSIYGKIADNLFVDVGDFDKPADIINNDVLQKIELDVKKKIDTKISTMKNKALSNPSKGYVYQNFLFEPYLNDKNKKEIPYISVSYFFLEAEVSREFFENDLFKKMAEISEKGKVTIEDCFYKNSFEDVKFYDWYYDLNGNYLGDNGEVLKVPEDKNVNDNFTGITNQTNNQGQNNILEGS